VITKGTFSHRPFAVAPGLSPRRSPTVKVLFSVIQVPDPIRAGQHACFATNALALIDQDQAIGTLESSSGGADADAGRVFAMHTKARKMCPSHVRIKTVFQLKNPAPEDAFSGGILDFAGKRARVTTNAAIKINHHSIFHDPPPPSLL
jgi:hypothetical protein